MPRAPAFWFRHDSWMASVLSPLSWIVAARTAQRIAETGWRAPVPVVCCGNLTVGGAGKTTLVLDIAQRLIARGLAVHILLRGYGGSAKGTRRVQLTDAASLGGDEALLLAAAAPTWVGADRAASAQAAIRDGAAVLLMDDGLQNPTLRKDFSILTIDGATGFGNGRVLPAGPLREPIAAGAARCQAAVMIGPDRTEANQRLSFYKLIFYADLVQGPEIAALAGKRVLAFAGIARPEKFFKPLSASGAEVVATRPFPDHHAFTAKELKGLLDQAKALDAVLVTTPKDAVRLPPDIRAQVTVVGVSLRWHEEEEWEALLTRAVGGA